MHIGFKVEGRMDIDCFYPKPMYKELTKSAMIGVNAGVSPATFCSPAAMAAGDTAT